MILTNEQKQAIAAYVDAHFDEEVKALQEMVRIKSVKEEGEAPAPFGQGMRDCLDNALALGESLGFSARDLDGYMGILETEEKEESLGVLAHIDTVPLGTGWSYEPIGAQIEDGRLYGRGSIDNKGPAVCSLYALAAVKAANIPLSKKVMIMLGCDEESGWACIDRYKKTDKEPTMSFSPDGCYPLVFAERTIMQLTYEMKLATDLTIDCGARANVVPGEGEAYIPFDVQIDSIALPEGVSATATKQGAGTHIALKGTSAHASTPEKGKSALFGLLAILAKLPLAEGAEIFKTLNETLPKGFHGEGFDLDYTDESGRISVSSGILSLKDGVLKLVLDIRKSISLPEEKVLANIAGILSPLGFELTANRGQKGHMIPKDSELVQTLMEVYRENTGDTTSEPVAMGGGTYARAFNNAVAFGCEFPDEPMLAHMPDENIRIKDIRLNTIIIAEAIARLAGA